MLFHNYRPLNDPVEKALYGLHVGGLLFRRHIRVNDTHPTLQGKGYREVRLGYRVHGRGENRDIEVNIRHDGTADISLLRNKI